ncbi:hypothetical protein ACS0TY_025702 [Phlomoides rotata]
MNYSSSVGFTTIGIRANDAWSSNAKLQNENSGVGMDMNEVICLRDLEEEQKKLENFFRVKAQKREVREIKLEQQIFEIGNRMQEKMKGIVEKLEHITNTMTNMQLQFLNVNKEKIITEEESSCLIPGEIEENIPDVVLVPKLDREGQTLSLNLCEDRKSRTDEVTAYGSTLNREIRNKNYFITHVIYLEDLTAQGMHIINPLPTIDLKKIDGFHPISWILESNRCDIKSICSCNSDGIGKIDGFLEKNVTFDPLYIILVMFFIEIQVGNFHILLKFHVVRGYDPGGTFGKGRSTINGIQSQFKALLEASSHGHSQLVELLMRSDLIRPHAAVYALITTYCRGFVEVVDTLIKCGVDANATDRVLLQSYKPSLHTNADCTSLVAAIVSKQISVVQLLLKAGIKTDVKVQLGAWSWDMASGEEFRVGAGLAEPYPITWCAVEYFEATGSILWMLLHCIFPNTPHHGRTLLHHAILCDNMEAVKVLVKCGADIETPITTTQQIEIISAYKC